MLYWVFFSSFLSVFVKELSAAELCIGATDSTWYDGAFLFFDMMVLDIISKLKSATAVH